MAEEDISVITCDLNGLVEEYGAGAEDIFGWKAEELIGKESVAVFHQPAAVETLVPRLLKTAVEEGEFEEEVTLVRKDGSEFPAVLKVRPVYREGEHVGYMGYTHPL
ncbi:MAG: PAS domain-containing protein [Candidatus Thermoplasmatota archaeon]|nr:PAS domain-containing protein [Candidatus Thermoplasmatota archaeon]